MSRRPLRAAALAGVLLLAGMPAPTAAYDLEDELRRVRDRIDELAEMIDEVTAARSELAAEIEAAAAALDVLEDELTESEEALAAITQRVGVQRSQLEALTIQLRGAYAELSATEVEIADARAQAIETARSAYIAGGRDVAVWSVSVDRISSLAVGMEYFARASGENRRELATLQILRERAASQKSAIEAEEANMARQLTVLERQEAELDAARLAQQEAAAELERALQVQVHLLATLDEEIEHFETELNALELEQGGIKRRIASRQRASSNAAPSIAASGFVRPVPGPITSGFGPRYHPILGYSRMHNGVDFRAAHGESIRAAQGGTVILANVWGGFGRTVVIDHGGGLSTLYAHQSSLAVSDGDTVEAGEVIGRVGSTGLATGAHLHFEVRVWGDPVDPAPYLSG